MTLSEQIVYGMVKPTKYKELIGLPTRRSVGYVAVMMLILCLVGYIVPVSSSIAGFGGFTKLFTEEMPKLEYNSDTLKSTGPFMMSINGVHILINTEAEEVEESRMRAEGVYIAIGAKKLCLNLSYGGKVDSYGKMSLKSLLPEGFNNDTLVDAIPYIYAYLVLGLIVSAMSYFIKYAFFALILSVALKLLVRQLDLELSFGKLFMISFYGQSLGFILSNFNSALGLVPGFIVSGIGIFITVHMITTAIASMKGSTAN
ncbi:MAG: DUF1189 family protein [Lachnospiraceae bacterium]|nr:DUF1189 family protein [Lachnospiraceae bacterium]